MSSDPHNTPRRCVCVHGHFYQPPRENVWLETIEVQESAHPYHDWNERITVECYAPNASSRILDEQDRIAVLRQPMRRCVVEVLANGHRVREPGARRDGRVEIEPGRRQPRLVQEGRERAGRGSRVPALVPLEAPLG